MAQSSSTTDLSQNPLLMASSLPFGAIDFSALKEEHFAPAFDEAIRRAHDNLARLLGQAAPPNFANTIEALELVSEDLEKVTGVLSGLKSLHSSPQLEAIAQDLMPKATAFAADLYTNPALFFRVKTLFDQIDSLGLSGEQRMLLDKVYKAFCRSGALLDPVAKARVKEIDMRLTLLAQMYMKHVNDATNSVQFYFEDRSELEGIPERELGVAAAAAKRAGHERGWLFTLRQPSYMPVMTYAKNRALRERAWRAREALATTGEWDNRPLILEITKLRAERARLLGFANHAAFTVEERMAKTPERVLGFLQRLADVYRLAAQKDREALETRAGHPLKPWDVTYYSELLKTETFHFESEQLRPYFSADKALDGALKTAERLHHIQFKPRNDIPVWHPSVKVFEVVDARKSGPEAFVSLFYVDLFTRESKKPGAWMSGFKDAGLHTTGMERPHVLISANFAEPTEGHPSLLGDGDVTTLFHEMGHALHGMLTTVRYRSLAGTNVAWDFVELPSQINENWAFESEVLDLYAHHYETGERIPPELVDKMRASERFMAGWIGLRQLFLGMLDMSWHTLSEEQASKVQDPQAFERGAVARYVVMERPPEAFTSTNFSHIFAGGYAAGYYSYKWADVLAADAFAYFKSEGIFSPVVAERFRETVLRLGGSVEAAELYRNFRGQDPNPDALLIREGLETLIPRH